MSFPKIRDGVIYALGVYTACGIAHNVIRRLGRPRHYRKIIVRTDSKGGGEGNV